MLLGKDKRIQRQKGIRSSVLNKPPIVVPEFQLESEISKILGIFKYLTIEFNIYLLRLFCSNDVFSFGDLQKHFVKIILKNVDCLPGLKLFAHQL